jgi:hypothetical protein
MMPELEYLLVSELGRALIYGNPAFMDPEVRTAVQSEANLNVFLCAFPGNRP